MSAHSAAFPCHTRKAASPCRLFSRAPAAALWGFPASGVKALRAILACTRGSSVPPMRQVTAACGTFLQLSKGALPLRALLARPCGTIVADRSPRQRTARRSRTHLCQRCRSPHSLLAHKGCLPLQVLLAPTCGTAAVSFLHLVTGLSATSPAASPGPPRLASPCRTHPLLPRSSSLHQVSVPLRPAPCLAAVAGAPPPSSRARHSRMHCWPQCAPLRQVSAAFGTSPQQSKGALPLHAILARTCGTIGARCSPS